MHDDIRGDFELSGKMTAQAWDRIVERKSKRPAVPMGWLTTKEAAKVLGVKQGGFCHLRIADHVQQRARTRTVTRTCRGCGAMYKRSEIERIALIKRRCGVRLKTAIRIFAALKDGPL